MTLHISIRLAEATYTSAISAARDFIADVGAKAAEKSGGLLAVARCNPTHPERDGHQVMAKQFGLSLPVQKSHLEGTMNIPILRMRDWFSFFITNSCMHILHGLLKPHAAREESILTSFWNNFQQLHPTHGVFGRAASGALLLKRAVPLLLHGDEGRGRKHSPHFVASFHSILGRGFGKDQRDRKTKAWDRMECNFEGHTFTNRFMIATLRKKDYAQDNPPTWDALMQCIAEESRYMWEVGVSAGGSDRYWGVVISICGDWPFLHKCGGFSRSFNNIQKKVQVRTAPAGICHLCQAGQTNVEFEQVATRRPKWMQTQFVQDPFLTPTPFATNLLHEPGMLPAVWSFDFFHCMHLGVLKHYLGSVLALLSEEEHHGSIDDRFAALSDSYKDWCRQNGRRCYMAKLTKESISWSTSSLFPTGTWHKGQLTTVLMEYVDARFSAANFDQGSLLGLAAEACSAIQQCIRSLYRSSLWLDQAGCKHVAECGLQFLRRYSQLATLSKNMGRSLFIYQPKIHCFHHFMIELWSAHQRNLPALNPLGKSCQPSEDFIGRPSRLARRVTAQAPVLHRVMDRYLLSAYSHFVRSGFLIRPER